MLADGAFASFIGNLLICFQYGGEPSGHNVTLVNDSFSLLDYAYRGHCFLECFFKKTPGGYGVYQYVGLKNFRQVCG